MSRSIYTKQLERIISEIEITSLKTFKVNGKEEYVNIPKAYVHFPEDLKSFGKNTFLDENQQKANLIQVLTNTIYSQFYCGINPENLNINTQKVKSDESFTNQLSENNSTTNGWDYNWTIYHVDASGNAFAHKNDELRWLSPNTYRLNNPNQKNATVNSTAHIVRTKEDKKIQPVFYYVFSEEMFPQEIELSRIYWNVKPEGAPALVNLITTKLNEYKIPFQFKCLNHPDLYVRTDTAVLYLDKKHVSIVKIILKEVIASVAQYLENEVPMFTKKIAAGVSYAEDPGRGQSFGMNRSQAISEALVNSFESKNNNETLQKVINHLEKKGMNINTLHLNKHTSLIPTFPSYE